MVWAPIVGEWYERVNNAGAVEHRHYVRSSERVVAVVTKSSAVTKTQYLHTDHAGSVDVVSTSTGALDERRSYDPFGARRNPDWGKPPGALTNGTALGFTGHLGDEELGLVFMRGRVYDPKLGRFLTPDPFVTRVLSGQNWNRYAYVENNPLNYTDPSGFQDEPNARPPSASPPKPIADNGRVIGGLEVLVIGVRPPRPEPLGAMRTPVDVGSFGDTAGFYPDAPASGSERDQADGLDIMLDVLEGAATGYGQDVLSNAQGMVLFAVFPQGYFAWQGYNFWSGVADVSREGYAQDGIWGGIAAGLGQIANVFVPVVDAGIGLAKTIDAAEKGDYKHAGEYGYGAAKAVAGVLAVGIGAGVARGKGGGGGGRNLHAEATAARDALVADLSRMRHPPATVVGAYSPSSGRVTAGASRGGGLGCAEAVCADALRNPPDIRFTEAIRPRTGEVVPVCPSCEATFGRQAFPDPATRFRSDL